MRKMGGSPLCHLLGECLFQEKRHHLSLCSVLQSTDIMKFCVWIPLGSVTVGVNVKGYV